jgi:hypothetical protein
VYLSVLGVLFAARSMLFAVQAVYGYVDACECVCVCVCVCLCFVNACVCLFVCGYCVCTYLFVSVLMFPGSDSVSRFIVCEEVCGMRMHLFL